MADNDDTRARLRTAERFDKGPEGMSHGEQAAAHALYGTTDLTPEQAYNLATTLPHGVEVGQTRHMFGIDSDDEPCTLTAIDVAGVYLLVFPYLAPHGPQVLLFDDAVERDRVFGIAETAMKDRIAQADTPYAAALRQFYGIQAIPKPAAPAVRPAAWMRRAHNID